MPPPQQKARPSGGADRRSGLEADVATLRVGRGRAAVSVRALLVAGGVLAPVGLLLIVLGWFGASRTPNLREQIPYLISGGLLGLGLVFLGGFLYFSRWLTQLVHDQRAGTDAVTAAVDRLARVLERPPPVAMSPVRPRPAELVVTGRGTMAHRPECRVVAGRPGVRPAGPDEPLTPCRLCQPEL